MNAGTHSGGSGTHWSTVATSAQKIAAAKNDTGSASDRRHTRTAAPSPTSAPSAATHSVYGRSAVPDAGMHWSGTAADVLATIDELGLDRPFGIGHSMGGASLVLAEQARPGTFRGLWIFEPIIFPPSLAGAGGDNPLVAGARRRRADFDSAAAAYDNFASKPPFSVLDPQALAAYVEYGFEPLDDGSVTLRCRPEVEAATYSMGPEHDAFAHLGDVECPVTVARGGDTGPGPAALVPAIVDGLPRGRIEEHPALGHFGPLEDPRAIAGSIAAAIAAAGTD